MPVSPVQKGLPVACCGRYVRVLLALHERTSYAAGRGQGVPGLQYICSPVRICHLASVPEGGKLCITAGGASIASGTCGF